MPCADLLELISAYVDGETLPAQSELVEAHCAVCPHCQDVARRHRETVRLLRLVGPDDWSVPDLRLRVAHATRKVAADWHKRGVWYGLPVGLLAALALLAGQVGSGRTPGPGSSGMVAAAQACACRDHMSTPVPLPAVSAGMHGRMIWMLNRVEPI